MKRPLLGNSQIVILRSLFMRGAAVRPVALERSWQREFTPSLTRRGLIEVWYRQPLDDDFALRGPFISLSVAGARLAAALFNRAPRRFSGAEQSIMINHPNRKAKKAAPKLTKAIARKVLTVVDAGLISGLGTPEPGKMCVEAAVCYAMGLPHGDNPDCVSRALRSLKIRLNDSLWSSDQARAKGLRRLAIAQLGSAGFLNDGEFIKRVLGVLIRKTFPGAFRAVAAVIKGDDRKGKWLDLAARCEAAPEQISPREARQFFLEFKQNAADAAAGAYAAADAAAADAAAYAAADAAAYAAADAVAYAAAYAAADAAADAAAAAAYAAADAAAYAAADDAVKKKSVARDKSLAAFCEEVVQVLIGMKAPGCKWLDLAPLEVAA